MPVIATPAHPSRSSVPDLLFEDEQHARIHDIQAHLDDASTLPPDAPLHRLTVFLTYKCNLDCPYCKTIARTPAELESRPEKRITMRLADFERLLDSYGAMPLRHIHFTGGEASLVNDMPAMIRLAKSRGAASVSTTSNGTLPFAVYERLLEAGLDELRISIDADNEALGRQLTGRAGAWEQTQATLRALGEARRRLPFFLILNVVVGAANRARVIPLLEFLLAFGPDDCKLIADVDAGGSLLSPGDAARAEGLIAHLPPERFPLLRRKLAALASPDPVGLRGVAPAADGQWKCYIPLTERTVDGVSYYPCSVYLREGGAPLGDTRESLALQQMKTTAFVERADCLTDPICAKYCLQCTRTYNIRCNETRTATLREATEKWSQPAERRDSPLFGSPTITVDCEQVRQLSDRLAATRSQTDELALDAATATPFFLLTPLGIPAREAIAKCLADFGIRVVRRRPIASIESWITLASQLYVRTLHAQRFAKAVAFETLWRQIATEDRAEVWELAERADFDRLFRNKYRIRGQFPSRRYNVTLAGNTKDSGSRFSANLRVFHVSDPVRIPIEGWMVERLAAGV